MFFHKFDKNSRLVARGTVSIDQADQILEEYLGRASRKYEYVEDWFSKCCFTISRSNDNFLQVNCDSATVVWFRSDRLVYDMPWYQRVFCNKSVMAFGGSVELAREVIRDFFNLTREQFESKYAWGYCNSARIGFVTPP